MTMTAEKQRSLLAICSVAGTAFSFRSVVSLALLDMTRDAAVNVDIAQVGRLNATGQFAYALGKLLGGAVVDAIGGMRSLFAILLLLAGSFGSMARAPGPGKALVASFAASRFGTAAVWTAAAVSIKTVFSGGGQVQALSIGQVAMRVGASLGSLLGGLLLSRLKSWRRLLLTYAGVGAVTSLVALGNCEPQQPAKSAPETGATEIQRDLTPISSALLVAARTPKLWLLFSSTTMITPTFDFVALLPQFLNDVYGMKDAQIGSFSSVFPLAAPPAILLASMALPSLSGKARAMSLLAAQALSAGGFLALAASPAPSMLVPTLTAIAGGCAPALSCVPPDWIMRWGGPRAGLFAGLHDVPGNLLAMWLYAKVPQILAKGGWAQVMRLYALQVSLGALCLAAFQWLEAADPVTKSPFEL
ncbi:unnamed protein product [Symbiodinium natans]|uniref:Major facilitator superfamily (MFS) profile domain-containing protein n=1 Tax=Symbiodinium natans TaxID=878477 RepID=A0A812HD11_9DINO|nr:unnamed protein product [Symbiodinium natans]